VRGVAGARPRHPRLGAQLDQPGQQENQVDRAPHRGAHAHVRMLPGGPGERHREIHYRPAVAGDPGGDLPLRRLVLVAEDDPADPVRDGVADRRGPDRVERVHGRDQPETLRRLHRPEPGYRDLGLSEDGDQGVERLLRDPVELLQVEKGTRAHGRQQRAVGEAGGDVALGQHLGRVVLPDQPGRGELGVALGLDGDLRLPP
jgi:hypothetical protein